MEKPATLDPRARWRALRALPRTLRLCWRLLRDRRVAWWSKTIPVATLAYVILPTDVLPDTLPVLGQLDDLTLILAAAWAFVRSCPPDVVREHGGNPAAPPAFSPRAD